MDKQMSIGAISETVDAALEENMEAARRFSLKDYIQLTKPRIIVSNLITAFGGFWVASAGKVDWTLMLYMLVGTALVMASGCVLNNYLDRDLDRKMERTQHRPLPEGRLFPRQVLVYGFVLGIAGLALLAVKVNMLSALLGFVGIFVYVIVYTAWLKRTSVLSTSIGGISGAMPPVIGYCAASNHLDIGAWIFFWILFLWQPPHFWALGIRRKEEYRAAGFPLLPVVRGNFETKIHMIRYTVMIVPVSLLLYAFGYVGFVYFITAAVLGLIWTFLCLAGFKIKEDADEAWSRKLFIYSINYLTILFIVMVVDTVHK